MSISVMSRVWEGSSAKGASLLILLALADVARDNGVAWPSIATLAARARMSERQVMRILKELEVADEIEVIRSRKHGNTYWVKVWENGVPDFDYCKQCGVVDNPRVSRSFHKHHRYPEGHPDRDKPDNIILVCPACHNWIHNSDSDKMSPQPGDRDDTFYVTLAEPEVTPTTLRSDIAMSHESLKNPQRTEPPSNPKKTSHANTGKNAIRKEFAEDFSQMSGLVIPEPETEPERKTAGKRWWQPIRRMCIEVEWDPLVARNVMGTVLDHMDSDGLTVDAPASIEKTFRATIAAMKRGAYKKAGEPKGNQGLRDYLRTKGASP